MISIWSFPNRIVFGPGAVAQLADVIVALGVRRPLVVSDPGVVKCGLLERAAAPLRKAGLGWAVYDGVEANPTEASVYPGVETYHAEGCDGIVALGGGSALDAAKAIRLAITHHEPLETYDDLRDGAARISAEVPPMVAIPTTAGTGSEVGRSAVITLKATGRKTVIFSPHLLPSIALADPELTLDLPPHLTAATGMDAMTHNLEAYLAIGFHPMCDAIALRGVETVSRNLRTAVQHGKNLEARTGMMAAAIMGAVAFQKGLGTVHSLAHPLSTVAGMHHGLTNAILLPHVMRFNLPAAGQRLADLAPMLGVDTRGLSTDAAARAGIAAIEKLNADIGIPTRLRDAGGREDMIPIMVPLAMEDGCRLLNPRPTSAGDIELLYRQAY
ncbi:MAG TPA: iron-containing alcohol dehydrogenase [Terriglobia bacterium]|nr:iron-containing alcohol dehydrogenase [Terriglobia bacterium]